MLRINADELRAKRKEIGFTGVQLAELVGVTEGAIRSYETGKRNPKQNHLEKIAAAFNVEPETLYNYGINSPTALITALTEAERNGLGKLYVEENGIIFIGKED